MGKYTITERELEDYIHSNSQTKEGRKHLLSVGLPISSKMFRQVELGKFGRLDLISIEKDQYSNFNYGFDVDIYELKSGLIGTDTINQSMKYYAGVIDALNQIKPSRHCITINLIGNTCFNQSISDLHNFLSISNDQFSINAFLYGINQSGQIIFQNIEPKREAKDITHVKSIKSIIDTNN